MLGGCFVFWGFIFGGYLVVDVPEFVSYCGGHSVQGFCDYMLLGLEAV